MDSKHGQVTLPGKTSKKGVIAHNTRMLGKEKPRKRKKHPMTEDELLELCSEMSKDVDEGRTLSVIFETNKEN